jgi:hypothetical protein
LLIADKIEDKWTAAELNTILLNNVVRGLHCHLHRFGGIKWEFDLFFSSGQAYIVYDVVYDIVYDIV